MIAITPRQAWLSALQSCYRGGDTINSRGLPAREVMNATCEITKPWVLPFTVYGREFREFIGAAEAVQLVGGFSEPAWMVDRVQAFGQFLNDDGFFHGAYGPRVIEYLGEIIALLMADPDSRQAVINVFSNTRDTWTVPPKDVPCTTSLQFFIRHGRLHLTTTMRSNDVWLGLPYDLVQFSALQGAVAAVLGIPMGRYFHQAGSLHLYESNVAAAIQVLDNYGRLTDPPAVGQTWDYRPMFHLGAEDSSGRLDEVMWRCRHLQRGNAIPEPTHFEEWLQKALS